MNPIDNLGKLTILAWLIFERKHFVGITHKTPRMPPPTRDFSIRPRYFWR